MESEAARRRWPGSVGREFVIVLAFVTTLGAFDTILDTVRLLYGIGDPLGWQVFVNVSWWAIWAVIAVPLLAAARRLEGEDVPLPITAVGLAGLAVLATAIQIVFHSAILPLSPGAPGFRTMMAYHVRGDIPALELTVALAMLGIGYAVRVRARAEREALAAARLEAGLARERLDGVRRRLAPHFLMNALNSVTGLVQRGEREPAARMISRIGRFLSLTLREERRLTLPLGEELEILDEYLAIEGVRLGSALQIEVRMDPAVEGFGVPPFLLQPLAENVIAHGLDDPGAPVRIRITAAPWPRPDTEAAGAPAGRPDAARPAAARPDAARPDGLELSVEDDGPGWSADPAEGTGLSVTRDQLRLRYGSAAEVIMDTSPDLGGARVRVRIPDWQVATEARSPGARMPR